MRALAIRTALAATLLVVPSAVRAEDPGRALLGRWDLTVDTSHGPRGAWLQLAPGPEGRLTGVLVGLWGLPETLAVTPTASGAIAFVSPRWGLFTATGEADALEGQVVVDSVRHSAWHGVPAPGLPESRVTFAAAERLFDGRSLSGWTTRDGSAIHGWLASDGVLASGGGASDLVSEKRYRDFKLHVEYRTSNHTDSGIHLRGRYELQILGSRDERSASVDGTGAVYGFLAPLADPQKPDGEWNTLDLTLAGRTITATLNGKRIHDHAVIPGITGDAIDSHEGEPGPIVLQGYIRGIEFRNLVVTPAR